MTDARSLPPELKQAIASSPWTFEMLAEQSVVPVFIVQGDRNCYLNPACEVMTGVPRAELMKHKFGATVPPDQLPALLEWSRQIESGVHASLRLETCIVDRTGSRRWFDLMGWPISFDGKPAVAAMSVEITERRLAEAALAQSDERFRSVVGNIPGVIYRYRAAEPHRVEYISSPIEALCGYKAEEFLGEPFRTCAELVHPDDRELVEQAMREGLTGHKPFAVEFRLAHRDGETRRVLNRARPLYDYHGNVAWIDGVLLDVTRLTDLERRLRQAERLAIIGQTITDVTHHIKNITNTLRGSGWLLTNALNSRDLETVSSMWRVFQRNIERLAQLVEEMLNYTRMPDLRFEMLPIDGLLREIHEDCLALASTRFVALQLDLPPGLPPIRCDREALNDVMLNLVCNALDACEALSSGTVTISAAWSVETHVMSITVTDTGCGIDPAIGQDIFNPFFSTKGTKGNGLGLSIVQKLVHEHRGTIEYESERGFTKFTILLPQS